MSAIDQYRPMGSGRPKGSQRRLGRRDDLATISVEDDPPRLLEGPLSAADLAAVRRWIALNRAAILDHWHGRADGAELARALRPLLRN